MDGKLSDEFRYLLRGEELSARFPRIGSIVRYEELVGISKEVYMAILEGPKVQLSYALHHGTQATILLRDTIA